MNIDNIIKMHMNKLNKYNPSGPYNYIRYENLIIIVYEYNNVKCGIHTTSYFYSTLINNSIETIYEFIFTNGENERITINDLNKDTLDTQYEPLNKLKPFLLSYNALIEKSLISLLNRGIDGYIYPEKLQLFKEKSMKDTTRLKVLFCFLFTNNKDFNKIYYKIFELI